MTDALFITGRPRRWRHAAVIAMACLCALHPGPARSAEAAATIVVTSTGWHTGIAIARADLPSEAIPEIADFPDAAWIEFGWGDAEFYTTPDAGFLLALRSTLPGPAVMHVAGLWGHPRQVFPDADWAPVAVPAEGMPGLIAYLAASFERDGAARARQTAPGLYGFSRFFPATGRFHLFNTCNTWTARALAAAGLPVDPEGVQRASEVLEQVAPLAPRLAPAEVHIERIATPPAAAPDAGRAAPGR